MIFFIVSPKVSETVRNYSPPKMSVQIIIL
jgi:hypothetical protein